MDFLDLSNESTSGQLESCGHGKSWDACKEANCQEIWWIYQESLREQRKLEKQRRFSNQELNYRPEQKREYEIALEQKPGDLKLEDYEIKLPDKPTNEDNDDLTADPKRSVLINFQTIFPDKLTLRYAVQCRALTLRDGRLIDAYLRSIELPAYKRWEAIGKEMKCSGKTVARHFERLVREFLMKRDDREEAGERSKFMAVHVRGERGVHFYRRRQERFGHLIRETRELITDRAILRELRQEGDLVDYSEAIPVPLSSVNRLFAALIRVFATDIPDDGSRVPEGVSPADWEYNLHRGRRVLASKKNHTGPWTPYEVAKLFARGSRQCGACRTNLIRGFRINRRRITRSRRFCDDACKMRAERRKDRYRSCSTARSGQ